VWKNCGEKKILIHYCENVNLYFYDGNRMEERKKERRKEGRKEGRKEERKKEKELPCNPEIFLPGMNSKAMSKRYLHFHVHISTVHLNSKI
jgi:hypothetical protein